MRDELREIICITCEEWREITGCLIGGCDSVNNEVSAIIALFAGSNKDWRCRNCNYLWVKIDQEFRCPVCGSNAINKELGGE